VMGEGRSEATHWLRFVTSQGGGYLTIASALFVPQNEEVAMERALLLRGVNVCGRPVTRRCSSLAGGY